MMELDVVAGIAWSPDGQTLAIGVGEDGVALYHFLPPRALIFLRDPNWVNDLAFSPNGVILAGAGADGRVFLWNTQGPGMMVLGSSEVRGGRFAQSLAFSPDGSLLAVSSCNNYNFDANRCEQPELRLWDVETDDTPSRLLEGHSEFMGDVAFSPNGAILASSSLDGTVRLWDVTTGENISVLDVQNHLVSDVEFSPDGSLLAVSGCDSYNDLTGSCEQSMIRLWDMEIDDTPPPLLEEHTDSVRDIAFSPDGEVLASASGDETIRLWNVMTEESLAVLEGHIGGVGAVAFNPDGTLLASSSSTDNTVRLWGVSPE